MHVYIMSYNLFIVMIFPLPLQHPQFGGSSPGFPNDLALLELQTPFLVGGAIQIATLPSSRTEDFANLPDCWMTGWGRTSSNVTKTGERERERERER